MLKGDDYIEAYRIYKDKKADGYEREKCHALLLLSDGYSMDEVMDILMVSENSILEWKRLYREGGLEGLKNNGWGGENGQSWLNEEEIEGLDNILRKESPPGGVVGSGWRLKEIMKVVEERFNVKYSESGMKKILRKIRWSYQRGRDKYIKKDEDKEKEYKEKTKEMLSYYAESGKRVMPVAEDEAKVRLEGTIGYRWNPIGEQPQIPNAGRRNESVSIYGTVHLGTGEEFNIITDWQNTDWMIKFLDELQKLESDSDILLFWDRATYHEKSKTIRDYIENNPRIKTIEFPPSSPEENPKEPTWKSMRGEITHNHWYDSLDDLIKALCKYYKKIQRSVSDFLSNFGFTWIDGYIKPLPNFHT